MSRFLVYFFSGLAISWPFVFLGAAIALDIKLAAIVATIVGFIIGLMSSGFMVRKLKVEEVEINTNNKDPDKGLDWYEERIREQLKDMRFVPKIKKGDTEIFKPRGLYRIFESDIELERQVYWIRLRASRLFLRIIEDLIEVAPSHHDQTCDQNDNDDHKK